MEQNIFKQEIAKNSLRNERKLEQIKKGSDLKQIQVKNLKSSTVLENGSDKCEPNSF